MQISSSFNTAKVVGHLRVRGVFASGTVVPGGSVGSADIVFLDSPPLHLVAPNASADRTTTDCGPSASPEIK